MHPAPFIEIHPKDAARWAIEDGQTVEVRSRRGFARFPARVTKAIAPGCVFVPMHWGALWADNAEANNLTHPEACPISLEPELKACAVTLIPVPTLPTPEMNSTRVIARSNQLAPTR
jgi:ferredoxin-nitrate reductase